MIRQSMFHRVLRDVGCSCLVPLLLFNNTNKKANLILKEKDPARFTYKYGKDANEKSIIKQT